MLDLGAPNVDAPHWDLPGFVPIDCGPQIAESIWKPLGDLAKAQGWPVG